MTAGDTWTEAVMRWLARTERGRDALSGARRWSDHVNAVPGCAACRSRIPYRRRRHERKVRSGGAS